MLLKAPSKVLPSLPPPYETALAPIAHEGQPRIDARGLHGWLGSRYCFAHYMRTRVADYGFDEGADFYKIICKTKGRPRIEEYGFTRDSDFQSILIKTGGRPKTEYLLTVGMAKELAMLKRSNIGSQTRRYFIEMEQVALG